MLMSKSGNWNEALPIVSRRLPSTLDLTDMKPLLLAVSIGAIFNTSAYAVEKAVQLAAFDHGRLTTTSKCIRCHSRDQPDDDQHRRTQENCSTCHNTQSWKPTAFDSEAGKK
jgi:hypothetical protein